MMKKILALALSICILFSCSYSRSGMAFAEDDPYMLEYAMLVEPTDQEQIEAEIYRQLSDTLKAEYLIDVQTFYESKEAIEEGLYNSKESEYFGFLLSEVDAQFQGVPYVFSMDESGEIIVKEFVPYDDTWEKVLTNVAIGTGVILVCVTVSSLTVAAAPAVHLVFAFAANTAVKYGLTGAASLAVKSAVNKYVETENIEETLKSAALGASEGYKWGAIGGAISGAAAKAINLNGLKRATQMSMNEIAKIQKQSNFTDATIKNLHSMDEFNVYRDANLIEYKINGRTLLLPKDMDWNFVDPATGLPNRQLIEHGYNPVDPFGVKYEFHHVGQKTNSPLALLTHEQHHSNDSKLHIQKISEVHPHGSDSFWKSDKKDVLKCLALLLNNIL